MDTGKEGDNSINTRDDTNATSSNNKQLQHSTKAKEIRDRGNTSNARDNATKSDSYTKQNSSQEGKDGLNNEEKGEDINMALSTYVASTDMLDDGDNRDVRLLIASDDADSDSPKFVESTAEMMANIILNFRFFLRQ